MSKDRTFNILSLEGGGCNGMMYCYLLAELERITDKKCNEIFDFITGTSIGGIIAALLSVGKSAQECIQFFMDDAPIIFQKRWYHKGVFSSKYKAGIIEGILKGKFGNKTSKDCKTKLLIPAFNLTTEDPFFFKSYEGKDFPLWAACRATSSAQIYFPAFEYDGEIYWDGGNEMNSPEAAAMADAIKLGIKRENIKILSIGCGDYSTNDNPRKYKNCGIIRNLIKTFEVLFSSGSECSDYLCKQILSNGNYLVISPKEKVKLSLDASKHSDFQKRHEIGIKWVKENFHEIEEFILK